MRRLQVAPVVGALVLSLLGPVACAGPVSPTSARPGADASARPTAGPAAGRTPVSPGPSGTAPAGRPAGQPNELGEVPVLMYHQVLRRPRSVYDITPTALRAELERLAREGYRPVTAADYVAGRIDLPAGRHPVVLTFDDSTSSQLTLDTRGRPRQGTAVAILRGVAARNPGFSPTATFFVNRDPFADPGGRRYLRWLRANGFEVANHTLDHLSLSSLSAAQVRRQLAGDSAMIRRATGDEPVTMALPFGIAPRDRALATAGRWGGTGYAFAGVFLVGAEPAPSPYSRDFVAAAVPRIRSQGRRGPEARFGSRAWLDRLAAHPATRYTSDGDPDTISFPARLARELRVQDRPRARPY